MEDDRFQVDVRAFANEHTWASGVVAAADRFDAMMDLDQMKANFDLTGRPGGAWETCIGNSGHMEAAFWAFDAVTPADFVVSCALRCDPFLEGDVKEKTAKIMKFMEHVYTGEPVAQMGGGFSLKAARAWLGGIPWKIAKGAIKFFGGILIVYAQYVKKPLSLLRNAADLAHPGKILTLPERSVKVMKQALLLFPNMITGGSADIDYFCAVVNLKEIALMGGVDKTEYRALKKIIDDIYAMEMEWEKKRNPLAAFDEDRFYDLRNELNGRIAAAWKKLESGDAIAPNPEDVSWLDADDVPEGDLEIGDSDSESDEEDEIRPLPQKNVVTLPPISRQVMASRVGNLSSRPRAELPPGWRPPPRPLPPIPTKRPVLRKTLELRINPESVRDEDIEEAINDLPDLGATIITGNRRTLAPIEGGSNWKKTTAVSALALTTLLASVFMQAIMY